MKKAIHIFATAALALLLAACGEDDILRNPSTGETEGTESVTFTATVDYTIEEYGNGAKASTRATSDSDDAPTRFYAQAIDETTAEVSDVIIGVPSGDNYTFTFPSLTTGMQYTFMFWADNATDDVVPTNLSSIMYTPGNIAFAANAEGTPASVEKNITLKHVVTKVTLRSTTEATLTESKDVTLATTCATVYNVQNLAAATSEQHTYTARLTESSIAQNGDALSCYLIPASGAQDVTVGANLLTQTITSVPLAPNSHVILQGDLSENNPNWDTPSDAYKEAKFRSYFFEDGKPKWEPDNTNSCSLSGSAEDLTALFRVILRKDDFVLPDNGYSYFIGKPGALRQFYIQVNPPIGYYIGYRDGTTMYTFNIYTYNSSYPELPIP